MSAVKEQLLIFIREELLDDEEIHIDTDTSLFQDRVLDSLNLVALISYLEDTFHIKIKTSEISITHLDSVDKMSIFIQEKLK